MSRLSYVDAAQLSREQKELYDSIASGPRAAKRASSGSDITASPIHCGAMMRERVTIRRLCLVRVTDRAVHHVHRAAIRALGCASFGDV